VGSSLESTLHTLNSQQLKAVEAIVMETDMPLPPVLMIGPFGTGKTMTLAMAILSILSRDNTRVLVCTQSNR
jgi:DNA replication protein DnaC